jgi:hypothetical protein
MLQRVAPPAGVALAQRLWFSTPSRTSAALRKDAERIASTPGARRFALPHADADLDGFTLGEGRTAFLVHGWGGRASQLLPIGSALAPLGFEVSAIDLPGHGRHPARRTDLFQMSGALHQLADRQGPPELVVAHSFGAMATMLAFHDKPPATTVFLAPALSFDALLRRYAEVAGLTHRTEAVLCCRMREFLGGSLRVLESAARQWPGERLLIVHDPADEDASYALSARLARGTERANATVRVELHTVNGLGHYKPMRDAGVIAAIAAFASQGSEQITAA